MNDIQQRIKRASHTMLDIIDTVLATLQPKPAPNQPTPEVIRRQAANTLALWNACANRACRRARCCRGEPLNCLRTCLPLLPPEALASLMPRKRRRRH